MSRRVRCPDLKATARREGLNGRASSLDSSTGPEAETLLGRLAGC